MINLRPFGLFAVLLLAGSPLMAQTGVLGACGQPSALTTRVAAPLPADFAQLRLPLLLQRSEPAYVEFSLAVLQEVSLYTESTTGDPVLALFDSSGTLVDWDDDGAGDLNSLVARSLDAGTYCAQVRVIGTAPVESIAFNLLVESGTYVPDLPPEGTDDCGGPGLAGYLGIGLNPFSDPIGRAGQTSDETGESWYGLSVDAAAMLRIEAASDDIDTVVEVLSQDGVALHENDDYPGLGTNSRIEAAFEPGDYCVKVRGFANAQGGYTLAVSPIEGTAPPAQGANVTSSEPCGDPSMTQTLAQDVTASSPAYRLDGAVDPRIGAGWYSLSLAEPLEVSLQATSGQIDTVLELYDDLGGLLDENDDFSGMGTDSRIDAMLDPGQYCVLVRGFADAEGPFTVALSTAGSASTPDLPDPLTAGEIEELGMLAEPLKSYAISSDPVLWASFSLADPGPVTVEGISVTSTFQVAVYDADGTLVDATDTTAAFGAATMTLDLQAGEYLVALANDHDSGEPILRQITVSRP